MQSAAGNDSYLDMTNLASTLLLRECTDQIQQTESKVQEIENNIRKLEDEIEFFQTFLDKKASEANSTDTSLQVSSSPLSAGGSDMISVPEPVSSSTTSPLETNVNPVPTPVLEEIDMEIDMETSKQPAQPLWTWTTQRRNEVINHEKAWSSNHAIPDVFPGTGNGNPVFSNAGLREKKRKLKYDIEFERMYGHGRMKRGKTLRV